MAERAYRLLTEAGFPPEEIVFDPNVLAVATGIEAHDRYALDFIEATRWIKEHLPHAKVSGGVSNLSFAFRGNNAVREAMHSVFLYHAIAAGMDMGIVNPQLLQVYSDIEPALLERVEDVVLCRRADAAERLIDYAQHLRTDTAAEGAAHEEAWRTRPLPERIEYALLRGVTDHIETDTLEAYRELGDPMQVIDRLLMRAMARVGELFGQGKMFLPQVVKSARVMKRAVGVLTPYIEQNAAGRKSAGKVIVATVKGDVHDIGKNIVAVVMACNGYEIRDLGVMVEAQRIVDEAAAWGADAICLSGLITPSLDEMIHVVEEAERRSLHIPFIIGGATTSDLHTAVKIAPCTAAPVIHSRDASENNRILAALLGPDRETYVAEVQARQQRLRDDYLRRERLRDLIPVADARRNRRPRPASQIAPAAHTGRLVFPDFDIADVEPFIDWNFFFPAWGLKGRCPDLFDHPERGDEARKLFDDAQALLHRIADERLLTLQGVVESTPPSAAGTTSSSPMRRDAAIRCPCFATRRAAPKTSACPTSSPTGATARPTTSAPSPSRPESACKSFATSSAPRATTTRPSWPSCSPTASPKPSPKWCTASCGGRCGATKPQRRRRRSRSSRANTAAGAWPSATPPRPITRSNAKSSICSPSNRRPACG